MDNITKLIRVEIKKQFKSVRQFSQKSGIPYSTISNALSKGVGGTSYDTVVKICNFLNLKHVYDADVTVLNQPRYEIFSMLLSLDESAINTIKEVASVEHERCRKDEQNMEADMVSRIDFKNQNITRRLQCD